MDNLKLNATSMNAIISTLGAVVFATVRRLPPDQQAAFAADLAGMARAAERRGDTTLETLLIDMHRAAVEAP
jgi:class 3 adenylate cyclase